MSTKRFYVTSLVVLVVLSAYPLVSGARMVYLSIANGSVTSGQYAKYVVPYTALSCALIVVAALQPLLARLGRWALPAGLVAAYGLFGAVEAYIESIPVQVVGLTRLDPSTMTGQTQGATTADSWQAALCAQTPLVLDQGTLATGVYVAGNALYKVHYYLISAIMLTMVVGLLHSVTRLLRYPDPARWPAVRLRGIATAGLVGLCVFANTTAFFRQATVTQGPLAASLTSLFMIWLGGGAGVYLGSYLMSRTPVVSQVMPALVGVATVGAMYAGEAVMMGGGLYRFGVGWFFEALPGLVVAPVDVLVILAAGVLTWLVLGLARRRRTWPGKAATGIGLGLGLAVALAGPGIALAAPTDDPTGVYAFDANLYTNPLSSYIAMPGAPELYGLTPDALIIANPLTGDAQRYPLEYHTTPVGLDEFSSQLDPVLPEWLPDLTPYRDRHRIADTAAGANPAFALYRMDDELWLAETRGAFIWTIYRLHPTDAATLDDLDRLVQTR